MDPSVASDIRKAQKKDHTVVHQLDPADSNILTQFANFYDRFAALKNLGPMDRPWLVSTAKAGFLDLWVAQSPAGDPHAYHVFYRDPKHVRSLHSASLHAAAANKAEARKLGRAHKLLIWRCLTTYPSMGVEVFDFGGWYAGSDDQSRLGINKYKEAFGGKTVCQYQGEELLSLKARLGVRIARWFQQRRQRNAPTTATSLPLRPAVEAGK
jgi:hypothetical protein